MSDRALQGRVDAGWLAAWALLLCSTIPFRMLGAWLRGAVWSAVGGLLRERLPAGALQLTPEEVRLEGAGSFLGRAIEAESIESLALGGGISGGLALVELILAIAVLSCATGARLLVPLLLGWMAVIGFLAMRYWQSRRRWTAARLRMTHELIENMTGHRTRLAQQSRGDWHDDEDRALNGYLSLSAAMDGCTARLVSLAPRARLVLGIAGLAQMIGETGWQLSQGERSRLFLARALLQNADLTILDESFAALDPENLRLSLECALNRTRSLMVAAHP